MELPQEYFGSPSSRYPYYVQPTYKPPEPVRRKVFVSHYHGHQSETDFFLKAFGDVFIHRSVGALGSQNYINSNNPDYIMQCIRSDYIGDATVTIVLVRACTHSRRYIDLEIKGSLQQGEDYSPNGLMGIQMPSSGSRFDPPPRLDLNWLPNNLNCYAKCYKYPKNKDELRQCIEDAFKARTSRVNLLKNPKDTMFGYDRTCLIHNVVH